MKTMSGAQGKCRATWQNVFMRRVSVLLRAAQGKNILHKSTGPARTLERRGPLKSAPFAHNIKTLGRL